MTRALGSQKEGVIKDILEYINAIKPELHKNYENSTYKN